MSELFHLITSQVSRFGGLFSWVAYIAAFVVSVIFAQSAWRFWREEFFKHEMKWDLFEIKVPREVLNGPKAMDQFFTALHAFKNRPDDWFKYYWEGEMTRWYSFEMVGTANSIRFYVRTLHRFSPGLQALLYAAYSGIEILPAEKDYLEDWPKDYRELEKKGYVLFANELGTTKPAAYSIRTYPEFEEETGDEKGRLIDPMAMIIELLGSLPEGVFVGIQFLTIPDELHHWEEAAEAIVEKMKNTSGHEKEGAEKSRIRLRFRTEHESDTLEKIEKKLGKTNYETTIRYVYFAPKALFVYDIPYRGIMGYFNQFRNDRQSFNRNIMSKKSWATPPFIFPQKRFWWKKFTLYDEYVRRAIPEETFAGKLYASHFFHWAIYHKPIILSAEELATLYHIPTNMVLTASSMERIESKRLAAPLNLPE